MFKILPIRKEGREGRRENEREEGRWVRGKRQTPLAIIVLSPILRQFSQDSFLMSQVSHHSPMNTLPVAFSLHHITKDAFAKVPVIFQLPNIMDSFYSLSYLMITGYLTLSP